MGSGELDTTKQQSKHTHVPAAWPKAAFGGGGAFQMPAFGLFFLVGLTKSLSLSDQPSPLSLSPPQGLGVELKVHTL